MTISKQRMRSRREFLAGSGAVALAGLAPGIVAARPRRSNATEFSALEPGVRPNIVSVMCDDLNLATVDDLDSFDRMLGSQGIEFTNGCVTSPLCTPSRTSILTGQYAHNHGL